MICHTYILHSISIDRFYIGSTKTPLADRLRRHNTNHKGFTGRTNDWKVVYEEKFDSYLDALAREKEIKSWKSRKKIIELIGGSEHPDL